MKPLAIGGVELRRMGSQDVDAALELVEKFDPVLVEEAKTCFTNDIANPHTWPLERYRLVALAADRVVGTMGYGRGPWPSPGIYWTDWLVVEPAWRRRGVASMIYRELERIMRHADCRKVYLDVGTLSEQIDALAFHLRHGYGIEGMLADYWSDGQDLVVMAKELIHGTAASGRL